MCARLARSRPSARMVYVSEAEAASTPAVTARAEQRAPWRRVLVMLGKIALVLNHPLTIGRSLVRAIWK